MFKNVLKRFKAVTSGMASSAIAADEETVMEAIVAGFVVVAYSDGECSNSEVDKVNGLIKSNPQLKLFRNEPVRLFDAYCDQMEASSIQGRIDMMAKIAKMSGDEANSQRVLISAIEDLNCSLLNAGNCSCRIGTNSDGFIISSLFKASVLAISNCVNAFCIPGMPLFINVASQLPSTAIKWSNVA